MKKTLFILPLVLLWACHSANRDAQALLERAQTLYEQADYGRAKQAIDSLKSLYTGEIALQKDALQWMRRIEMREQERNYRYCDSLLPVYQAEVDSMKQYFVFEKTPLYDTKGRYVEKNLAATQSTQRLRVGVEEDGTIYLISVYIGASPIRHNQLKLMLTSGEYLQTEAIPFDGGANFSFKDDNTGLTHEYVTFCNGRDKGAILFLYDHLGEKINASCLGGKPCSFTVSQSFLESLIKSVDFSVKLTDIQCLKQEKRKAEKRIEYLKKYCNKSMV